MDCGRRQTEGGVKSAGPIRFIFIVDSPAIVAEDHYLMETRNVLKKTAGIPDLYIHGVRTDIEHGVFGFRCLVGVHHLGFYSSRP